MTIHKDITVIHFSGGQILLYLGQHHLLIQAQLLEKAYAKIQLWQQEELVGRVSIKHKDTSYVIRFPVTMNNSTVILKLFYRSYDIDQTHRVRLEQKETVYLSPQKTHINVYINEDILHIPYQRKSNLQIQCIIRKGSEIYRDMVLPITQKLTTGTYNIQFRKQIRFMNDWYTYMVWTQTIIIQSNQGANQMKQKQMLKRESRITNRILDRRPQKPRNELYANKDFIDVQNTVIKQATIVNHTASIFIILSFIFLFVFFFVISWYFIHHCRRRNRHDRYSAFPLVSGF